MSYNIIKQIGKGSFSEVYLCEDKKDDDVNDVAKSIDIGIDMGGFLIDSQLQIKKDKHSENYIIKEINIDSLVAKYMNKTEFRYSENIKKKIDDDPIVVNITPYKTSTQIPDKIQTKYNEQKYYKKRLINLIESEIEILQRISHENIIRFFSSEVKDSLYSIKMEYCECGDLYNILKTNTDRNFINDRNYFKGICNEPLQSFIIDITSAIKYLHNLHIIHRDIKLQNILIKKSDNKVVFKLADFGFACFDVDCSLNDSLNISDADFSSNSIKKKYYKLCGTPYYMAPEIILNLHKFEHLLESKGVTTKFYDKNIDVWSFGMSLYELIFNSLPYSNISDIYDLKELFSNKDTQKSLKKTINNANIISDILKELLNNLLIINSEKRINIFSLYKIVNNLRVEEFYNVKYIIPKSSNTNTTANTTANTNININTNINTNTSVGVDVVPYLRKDIITEPLIKLSESWGVEDNKILNSWDKVNRASSLIMKMSIDNSFMKWMFKKN